MGNCFEKNWRADVNSSAQISFFANAFLSPSHGLIFSWLQPHSHEISGLPRATSLILLPVTPPGSSVARLSEGGKKKKKRNSLDVRLRLQISTSPAEEKSRLACSGLKATSIYSVTRATSPGSSLHRIPTLNLTLPSIHNLQLLLTLGDPGGGILRFYPSPEVYL